MCMGFTVRSVKKKRVARSRCKCNLWCTCVRKLTEIELYSERVFSVKVLSRPLALLQVILFERNCNEISSELETLSR